MYYTVLCFQLNRTDDKAPGFHSRAPPPPLPGTNQLRPALGEITGRARMWVMYTHVRMHTLVTVRTSAGLWYCPPLPSSCPPPLRPVTRTSGGGVGGPALHVRAVRRTVPPYSLYTCFNARTVPLLSTRTRVLPCLPPGDFPGQCGTGGSFFIWYVTYLGHEVYVLPRPFTNSRYRRATTHRGLALATFQVLLPTIHVPMASMVEPSATITSPRPTLIIQGVRSTLHSLS